jgi:hypothetical protein
MGYGASDQMFGFSTISLLEHPKAPNIKRLKQMRRMGRHTQCDDLVLLAISLKVDRVVTFVPIEDQKTIGPSRSIGCTPIKVLQPLKA